MYQEELIETVDIIHYQYVISMMSYINNSIPDQKITNIVILIFIETYNCQISHLSYLNIFYLLKIANSIDIK